jgi:hypothetical protein
MDMRFGLWNVRSLYRAGSLMTVSRELARYKLDLAGVQEVRWKGGGTEPLGEYIFFYLKVNHEAGHSVQNGKLTGQHHIFTKRKHLGVTLTKMYWLLGRKSQLSLSNKLLLYKTILKPIWSYGIQL